MQSLRLKHNFCVFLQSFIKQELSNLETTAALMLCDFCGGPCKLSTDMEEPAPWCGLKQENHDGRDNPPLMVDHIGGVMIPQEGYLPYMIIFHHFSV